MPPTLITYGQVVQEMEEIVREVGDSYYYEPPPDSLHPGRPMCYYVHSAGGGSLTPGCIVGVWLHRFHHVALETLQELEGKSAQGVLIVLRDRGVIEIEPPAIALVLAIQKLQDGWDTSRPVQTWRQALTQAPLNALHAPA